MPSKAELLAEANRRGLLEGKQKALFDEAVKRGLIKTDAPAEDAPAEQPTRDSGVLPAPVVEGVSAINRGITEAADFFTTGPINTVSGLVGSDFRVPTFTESMQSTGAGQEGYMEPGLARDVVQAGGEMAPAAAGIVGAAKGIPSVFSRQSATRQALEDLAASGNRQAEKIVEGVKIRTADPATAKRAFDPAGNIVKDKLSRNAIKQGFDEGVVAAIKASTPATRKRMRHMVGILEGRKRDARRGFSNRPWDVVGDAIQDRIIAVRNVNKRAGNQLDQAAKGLKGKFVDVPSGRFMGQLQELGVTLDDNLKPVFEGSDVENMATVRSVISTVLKRLKNLNGDAYEAHRLKRFIDDQVTYGKSEGLSGNAEHALKSLRRDVDQALDARFADYKEANDVYAETIGALNDFQDVAGRKIDLTGPNAEKAIGTLSRGLMSNIKSRVNMMNALADLEELVVKHGKKPDDDILSLALFADELDSVFKPVARTSLAGEMAKTAGDTAAFGTPWLVRTAIQKGADKVRNVNEEQALKDIKALLAR